MAASAEHSQKAKGGGSLGRVLAWHIKSPGFMGGGDTHL